MNEFLKLSIRIFRKNWLVWFFIISINAVSIGVYIGTNYTIETLDTTEEKHFSYLEDSRTYVEQPGIYDGSGPGFYFEQIKKNNRVIDIYIGDDSSPYIENLEGGKDLGVSIDKNHAQENNLEIGDDIEIEIKGEVFVLEITNLIYSPYYTFFIPLNGEILPDNKDNAYIYINRDSIPIDVQNNLYFNIEDTENIGVTIEKDDFLSVSVVRDETTELETTSEIFPILLLFVSAIVTYTSFKRIISKRESEHGTLSAFGIRYRKIFLLYFSTVILITVFSTIFGILIGIIINEIIIDLFKNLFNFPKFYYNFPYELLSISALVIFLVTLIACITTLYSEQKKTVIQIIKEEKLKKHFSINLKFNFIKSEYLKIALRGIFKKPSRILISIAGLSLSLGTFIIGLGLYDTFSNLEDEAYHEFSIYDSKTFTKDYILTDEIEDAFFESLVEIKNDNETNNFISFLAITTENNAYKDINPVGENAVVSNKIANKYGYSQGDTLDIIINDETYTYTVSKIVNTPVNQSIYVDIDTLGFSNGYFNENTCDSCDIENLYVIDKEDIIADFSMFLGSIRSVSMIFIASALIIMINIVNNLFQLIKEDKNKKIIFLRAFGNKKKNVYKILFYEFLLIYLISSIISIPLGLYIFETIFASGWGDGLDIDLYIKTISIIIPFIVSFVLSFLLLLRFTFQDNKNDYVKVLK